jgi:hypothetical protein
MSLQRLLNDDDDDPHGYPISEYPRKRSSDFMEFER